MLRRFVHAFLWFAGLVVPAAFSLALLAAPTARPEPATPPGCDRSLADATANVATMKARVRSLGATTGADTCTATRLYFLELVGTRRHGAVQNGAERDRDLGRFDADVEHTNEAIAARCL